MFRRFTLVLVALVIAVGALTTAPARSAVTEPRPILDSDLGYLGCLEALDGTGTYCIAAQRLDDGVHVLASAPSNGPLAAAEEYVAPSESLQQVSGVLGGPAIELDATLPSVGRIHIVSDSRSATYGVGHGGAFDGNTWIYAIEARQPWGGPSAAIVGFQTDDTGSIGGVEVRAEGFPNANWVGRVNGAFTRL